MSLPVAVGMGPVARQRSVFILSIASDGPTTSVFIPEAITPGWPNGHDGGRGARPAGRPAGM